MQGAQVLIPVDADLFWQQVRKIIEDVLDERGMKPVAQGEGAALRLLKVKEVCELFHIPSRRFTTGLIRGSLSL